jgi:hypothetical protein
VVSARENIFPLRERAGLEGLTLIIPSHIVLLYGPANVIGDQTAHPSDPDVDSDGRPRHCASQSTLEREVARVTIIVVQFAGVSIDDN